MFAENLHWLQTPVPLLLLPHTTLTVTLTAEDLLPVLLPMLLVQRSSKLFPRSWPDFKCAAADTRRKITSVVLFREKTTSRAVKTWFDGTSWCLGPWTTPLSSAGAPKWLCQREAPGSHRSCSWSLLCQAGRCSPVADTLAVTHLATALGCCHGVVWLC